MAKSNNPLFNQTSGKIGSLVVSQNGVVRERVYRNTSQTEAQVRQRAALAGLASSWRTLTESQRGSWRQLEGQMNTARSINPSGFQTFMQINGTLIACGQFTVQDAPATPDMPGALPPLDVIAGMASGDWLMSIQSAAYVNLVQVYATAPVSPGRNSFGASDFKQIGTLPALTAGSTALTSMYSDMFGVPALNLKIAVTLYPVSLNGFRGSPIQAVTTTVEDPSALAAPASAEKKAALKAA